LVKDNRLHNLDYLRGIAAFLIMIYHHLTWIKFDLVKNGFWEKVGIYGVSVFYVLSGVTLYFVYNEKLKIQKDDLIDFYKKRLFRIFPLLWLTTFISILLSKQIPDFFKLFLNLSGLFAIYKWDETFSPGIWSIGNELSFYLLFPIVIALKNKKDVILFSIMFSLLFVYFTFYLENYDASLQWKIYTNPLNQFMYFLIGILICKYFKDSIIKDAILVSVLFFSIIVFLLLPVTGNLVVGMPRLILTICIFIIVFALFKMKSSPPKFIHDSLKFFGDISYSIYLLHPIVYTITGIIFYQINKYILLDNFVKIIASVLITIALSKFVYLYFEKFFIRKGNKISFNQF
jgi:exopolysaccharide production protein ExoZ